MLDIVLRTYGESFDVDDFVSQYPAFTVDDVFRQGELDMLGHPNAFSGFDEIVAENETADAALVKLEALLQAQTQAFMFLKAEGVHCVLDIDVTVSTDDETPTSLMLPATLLGQLDSLNIAVEFTAYPKLEGLA